MEVQEYVPEGYKFTFQEYLFNTQTHRLTQAQSNWRSFYLLDEKRKAVLASWHLHVNEGVAKSPYKATFGGFDFSEQLTLDSLSHFIGKVSSAVVEPIEVILAPENLNPQKFTISRQSLLECGFDVVRSQVNATISVTDQQFEEIIHKSERKKLKKSIREGLTSKKLDFEDFHGVYQHLMACRAERDWGLSMSESQLKNVADNLSDHFHLFGVFDKEKLVASAITIQLSEKALYVFYGGHIKEYDRLSPAVLLHGEIYAFCQKKGMKHLDLGTSSMGDDTDLNLLNFKKYIGAETGLKLTLKR
ncbi:GNAT family N-acetyltransferase [Fulvivirga lutea]|uniref:GNAT family N-acetyltransferase n=1 Tax=Fulvivirga lutea TaxID=2810512 RepID=A0A974WI72_9BACT|nr:GNAT family N-acetyltransferase [Fulvivirga lutea]QSE97687.1 GNAT family N-acetyltransferase [Fulvivirga lutea]